ncbi:MAG: endonuclease/exonuclease/phosphatase family protein [Acidobacteriota bacterium]|nr:endonuclease/exonuclease/phosphatase family protein [Acidobacteriota bacterium]
MTVSLGDRATTAAQAGVLLAGLLVGLSATPLHAGKARPILPDGEFGDWKKAGKPLVDPAGDGTPGGLDFGRLWLVNDDNALHLRVEIGRETLLQETGDTGNKIRLYLDTDAKESTGLPVEGLGADLEVRFGEQELIRYDVAGLASSEFPGGGSVMGFPTFSSDVFEIRIEMPLEGEGGTAKRRKVRLVFAEDTSGGDRLPDQGVVTYKYPKKKRVGEPAPIDWLRESPQHLRLLSLNVEDSNIATRQALYTRLLGAISPDILAFQSLTDWSADQTEAFVASILPAPAAGWSSAQIADIVLVSALPILDFELVDNNLAVHIDLPNELTPHDLVLFDAHPPCCANDTGRDVEIDNLIATWRDLLAGNGPFEIDPLDAVVFAGDFNLVGFRRQFDALVHGRFIGPSHGEDFSPGRAKGSLAVAPLRHSDRRMAYTWRRGTSRFAPGRLDFIFFSDDVATLEKGFVVDTQSMSKKRLRKLGLKRSDSLGVSDHLALVADFSFAPQR